ncbi:GerMN domain-containing protein [Fusibacter sp. 3D3]|uniref:GerMN domain-containing protein n=1 Tax=Fusibacter sp. 3D3 TaxID=1048380 RepID=UPI000852A1D5|nr:GerMN domain-containing protein [Fusibacter sp. 3D3]GAU78066.1 hypothetical protein F3D3_2695 [Fusibacter sp. 3D3]
MFRFLSNMLFIVILFLLVTAMPLSKDVLTINIFQPVIDTPSEEVPVMTTYKLEGAPSSIDYTPDQIEFSIVSTPHAFSESLYEGIEVLVYDGDQLISTTNLKDLSPAFENKDEHTDQIAFSLKTIVDALKANQYHVEIKGTENSAFSETLDFMISNEKFDKLALETMRESVSGKLTLNLYYPTDNYELLVPVTRIINYPDNRSRTALKELDKGPASTLGLIQGDSIWPYASKLAVKSRNASVYIYKPEYVAFENNFQAAVDAITYTLTSLDFIDQTNFYIDNSKAKPFGSVDLKQTFTPRTQNFAYLSYNKDSDYMLLVPTPVESLLDTGTALTEDVSSNAKLLWQVLKTPHFNDSLVKSAPYLNSTIPRDIELKEVIFEAGKLTLSVDQAFDNAFNGHDAYIKQMLNSISKSYYSLEGVTEVHILVNSESPVDFHGYDLTQPLVNPTFINLEP